MNCTHPHTLTLVTLSGVVTWCQQCGSLHIDGAWQEPHPAHDTDRPPANADADMTARIAALFQDEPGQGCGHVPRPGVCGSCRLTLEGL